MEPIRTKLFDGVYQAPEGTENIGDLPFFRRNGAVFSIWDLSDEERAQIAQGYNLLVGQVGEPIHPISLSTIDEQEDNGTKETT